jgi:hypothetical protein
MALMRLRFMLPSLSPTRLADLSTDGGGLEWIGREGLDIPICMQFFRQHMFVQYTCQHDMRGASTPHPTPTPTPTLEKPAHSPVLHHPRLLCWEKELHIIDEAKGGALELSIEKIIRLLHNGGLEAIRLDGRNHPNELLQGEGAVSEWVGEREQLLGVVALRYGACHLLLSAVACGAAG